MTDSWEDRYSTFASENAELLHGEICDDCLIPLQK
jgi:hypothetical protein